MGTDNGTQNRKGLSRRAFLQAAGAGMLSLGVGEGGFGQQSTSAQLRGRANNSRVEHHPDLTTSCSFSPIKNATSTPPNTRLGMNCLDVSGCSVGA